MSRTLLHLCAAAGLGAAAGLNALLPLWVVSAAARAGLVPVPPPFTLLGSDLVFYGLGALALLEWLADKVDGLDTVVHGLLLPLSIGVGVLLAAWQIGSIGTVDRGVIILGGLLIGGVSAGVLHASRTVVRVPLKMLAVPALLVSLAEDVAALTLTGTSLGAPLLVPVILLIMLVAGVLLLRVLLRLVRGTLRRLSGWLGGRVGGWASLTPAPAVQQLPAAARAGATASPGMGTVAPASAAAQIWDPDDPTA